MPACVHSTRESRQTIDGLAHRREASVTLSALLFRDGSDNPHRVAIGFRQISPIIPIIPIISLLPRHRQPAPFNSERVMHFKLLRITTCWWMPLIDSAPQLMQPHYILQAIRDCITVQVIHVNKSPKVHIVDAEASPYFLRSQIFQRPLIGPCKCAPQIRNVLRRRRKW